MEKLRCYCWDRRKKTEKIILDSVIIKLSKYWTISWYGSQMAYGQKLSCSPLHPVSKKRLLHTNAHSKMHTRMNACPMLSRQHTRPWKLAVWETKSNLQRGCSSSGRTLARILITQWCMALSFVDWTHLTNKQLATKAHSQNSRHQQ